ncbi:MAG: UDP-glucose 4-epimerase GalE [Acidobacteria bacterium]|nr:UDP-glucose 4-epimerase GalE [Acidobacteriota bacterium]
MAVLVTGGAGYIGSVTVRALLTSGEKVFVLDDLSTGRPETADLLSGAGFIKGDFADRRLLAELFDRESIDAVLHFAALTLVAESVERPLDYFRANVSKTLDLLEAMTSHRIPHFVFSSSAATFGIAEVIPIDEEHPQRPINPYGWSKKAVEDWLPQIRKVGGPAYIGLRYFNAAGASADGLLGEVHSPESHLIPNVLRAALDGSALPIYGTDYPTTDGTCERDFIHVEDLAAAHLLALQALRRGHQSGFYNLGNGQAHSIRHVVETARAVTGRDIKVVESARRPGDPPVLVASSARIKSDLGWLPKREALDLIIADAWRFACAPRR